jgi:hypothetical protein
MKLRMLRSPSGTLNGLPWPEVGEVVEFTNPTAIADLVRNGIAEIVPEPKSAPIVETAEKAPPENTAKRTAKPAPRKGPK